MSVSPIADLVPHAGRMCLLERVLEWDHERVVTITASHRSPENPLRSAGRLRAVHLCEYGAQAMAVHGGLTALAAGGRPLPGLLVALRAVELHIDYVDAVPGELIVTATRLQASAAAWQYSFEVRHGARLLAAGRAAIVARG
jgi:predicted hotdog family 3-hydroxylacyl-ACP dehydratase